METTNIFEKRRSANFFDASKNIDDLKLKELIDLAIMAPSAFNLQPWRLIIVRSKEKKELLYELSSRQPKILEAPVSIMVIADKNGWDKDNPMWQHLEKALNNQEMFNTFQKAAAYLYGSTEDRRLKFSISNASLLAMSIMYAATQLGIDTHPMSGFDYDGIKKSFGLKESEEFVMNIAVGYRDTSKNLYPRGYRRSMEEISTIV